MWSRKGRIFLVSAPSAAGKTTVVEKLVKSLSQLEKTITCTTRSMRKGEKEGKDYRFFSEKQFTELREKEAFLESSRVYSYHYGVLKQDVFSKQEEGIDQILVLDTQGVKKLRGKLQAITVFIKPPSLTVLQERMRKRATENPKTMKERLLHAKQEMKEMKDYDYLIINDQIQQAVDTLRCIVIAERHKMQK